MSFSMLHDHVTIIHDVTSHSSPKFKINKNKNQNKIKEKIENKNKRERKLIKTKFIIYNSDRLGLSISLFLDILIAELYSVE